MLIIVLRTLIVYLAVIVTMRLMGKRQLGELQPSELVSTILISNLASISIESPELPLSGSIVPVLLIAALELLSSALSYRCPRVAQVISGKPIPVIRNGQIDQTALEEIRFSAGDLLEALRAKDIFDPSQVAYALVETNGSLSVCKKHQDETVTRRDLELPPPNAHRPLLPFVIDGQVMEDNLDWCGKNRAWLETQLSKDGSQIGEILLFLGDDTEAAVVIKKKAAAHSSGQKG